MEWKEKLSTFVKRNKNGNLLFHLFEQVSFREIRMNICTWLCLVKPLMIDVVKKNVKNVLN